MSPPSSVVRVKVAPLASSVTWICQPSRSGSSPPWPPSSSVSKKACTLSVPGHWSTLIGALSSDCTGASRSDSMVEMPRTMVPAGVPAGTASWMLNCFGGL